MGLELAQYISFWGIFGNPSNSRNDVTKAQERNILLHDKQPLLIKEKEKKKKHFSSPHHQPHHEFHPFKDKSTWGISAIECERGLSFISCISGGLRTVVYTFNCASSVLGNLFKTLSLGPIPRGFVSVVLG